MNPAMSMITDSKVK